MFELVAHRGNAAGFPENTLPAFASALAAGVPWVELDVQLSADHVPFVVHDALLERTTRAQGDLRQLPAAALDAVDAGEPARFGERYRGTPLPRLAAFAELLAAHPGARAFVELKRASLQRHGREPCVERVLAALGGVAGRCVPISFDAGAVALVRARYGIPIGWVIADFDAAQLAELEALEPEFVFYDYRRARDAALPAGPWRWAAYEVKDAARARLEVARGASLIETMAPLALLDELRGPAAGPA